MVECKTVIAFANTSGGTIYIGVDDKRGVVGLDNADLTIAELSNAACDSIKPDVTLFVEYHKEIIDGKTIIKAEVQKGTSSPYYLATKGQPNLC